jgi:hypothetical protein
VEFNSSLFAEENVVISVGDVREQWCFVSKDDLILLL